LPPSPNTRPSYRPARKHFSAPVAGIPPAGRDTGRMSRGTLARRKPTPLSDRSWLSEGVAAAPLRIDRDAGVIYDVKVVGRRSPNGHGKTGADNGTEYTLESLRAAAHLYEGVSVKVNHPADRTRPAQSRDCNDTFGVLRNVRVGEDGLRADLHYYKTHPLADRVLEDVDRRLGQFGLSHNASAAGSIRDRTYVVEEIGAVNSVDLVDRPATNRNLWESTDMDETPVSTPAAADPDEVLAQGFDAACSAVLAGEGTADEKAKKIKELLKAHEKLASKGESATEGDETPADDTPADDKPADEEPPKMESLQTEAAVNKLCRAQKFIPSDVIFESLCALPTDDKRLALITETRAAAEKPANGVGDKPRSRMATVTESKDEYANDSWGRATRGLAASKN
jgi:hypothetical protein